MIHHVYLPVTDWSRSLRLYRPLLPTIGIEEGRRLGDSVGFGLAGRAISDHDGRGMAPDGTGKLPRLHVAFRARSRAQAPAFASTAAQSLRCTSRRSVP
jgi:extradiol dioxygenase family protein